MQHFRAVLPSQEPKMLNVPEEDYPTKRAQSEQISSEDPLQVTGVANVLLANIVEHQAKHERTIEKLLSEHQESIKRLLHGRLQPHHGGEDSQIWELRSVKAESSRVQDAMQNCNDKNDQGAHLNDNGKIGDETGESEEPGFEKKYHTRRSLMEIKKDREMQLFWIRRGLRKLVDSRWWECLVTGVILSNTLVLAIQSDWAVRHIGETVPLAFRVFEVMFTMFFTIELLIRIIAEGPTFVQWSNPNISWNFFDSIIVFSAISEEFVVLALASSSTPSEIPNVSGIRMVRLLRLARILRVLRVVRFFRDLQVMVSGIASSMKPLFWCLILLAMFMFCFSLLVLQVVIDKIYFDRFNGIVDDKNEDLLENFGTLLLSIYTLFLTVSGGMDWGEASDLLVHIDPVMGFLFVLYISFSVMCVLNIITCVFVDKANQFTKNDVDNLLMEEVATREASLKEMRQIFIDADSDDSACLNRAEFTDYIQEKRVQAYFRKIGLDVQQENAQALFSLIDLDNSGSIGLEEFMDGCAQFVGTARQLDIARLRNDNVVVRQGVQECLVLVHKIAEEVAKLHGASGEWSKWPSS